MSRLHRGTYRHIGVLSLAIQSMMLYVFIHRHIHIHRHICLYIGINVLSLADDILPAQRSLCVHRGRGVCAVSCCPVNDAHRQAATVPPVLRLCTRAQRGVLDDIAFPSFPSSSTSLTCRTACR